MTTNRYKIKDGKVCIELMLKVVPQLFDRRDPAPFRERDLDDDAASYILSAVREFSVATPIRIVIYFSEEPGAAEQKPAIVEAIRNHFAYEELLTRRRLKSLFVDGQISLVIGLFFLFLCMTAARFLLADGEAAFSRIVGEGLIIIGWVAMWRPLDIFLYEWWPVNRLKKYLAKLAAAEIEIVAAKA